MKSMMKEITTKFTMLMATMFVALLSFAQEKKVDIDINTKPEAGTNFFTQPWVWIVGGALFILLLVALLRGGGSNK